MRNISGVDGVAEFRKLWELNNPDSPLWSELPKLLFLGSAMVKQDKAHRSVRALRPFQMARRSRRTTPMPRSSRREALLKARPSASAPTLQTLSYDLVEVSDWEVADDNKDSKQNWVAVKTPAGTGYLPQEQVAQPARVPRLLRQTATATGG